MDWFQLTPESITYLVDVLLSGVITRYFLTVKGKTTATWLLTAMFAAYTLYVLFLFLTHSVVASSGYLFYPLQSIFGTYALFAVIAFAYVFLGNPFPRESNVVLPLLGVVSVALTLYIGYHLVVYGPFAWQTLQFTLISSIFLLMVIWTIVLFLRKTLRFSTYTGRFAARLARPPSLFSGQGFSYLGIRFLVGWMKLLKPQGRNAQAHRSFVLLFLFPLLITLAGFLRDAGIITWLQAHIMISISSLLFVAGFALVYVNHAPEPTTFQVKTVGLSLFTMLAVLGLISMSLFQERGEGGLPKPYFEEPALFPPQHQSLHFEPDGAQRYRVDSVAYHFDADLGQRLDLEGARGKTMPIGFSFPFYDQHWAEMYVYRSPLVSFDGPFAAFLQWTLFYDEQPKIAPIWLGLDPTKGGGLFLKREPDKVTITWSNLPQSSIPSRINTIQLVLHADGAIDFTYGLVEARQAWIRGLYPGGAYVGGDGTRFLKPLADLQAGTLLVEDNSVRYKVFQHNRIYKMAYGIVGATVFILLVFPFFFHLSLVKPLNALLAGVRRVNDGHRDVHVPLRVKDEIGHLTDNFNHMTGSLKQAEAELKAYAESLEVKVAERTAALQQSLDELRATQAQLIQSEKMASLGQLTAGIAHEIKNPLNFVNNLAEVSVELTDELREELAGQPNRPVGEVLPEIDELLGYLKINAGKIHEQGRRADGIVESMMQHASGGTGEREAKDVNAFVEEYVNLAYHGARAQSLSFNVTMERDYDEAVGAVEMVPQEMGRVLINLLNNAFYAVHEQAARANGPYTPTVEVSTRKNGDTVEIRIRDNGPGIHKEDLPKIFEPFFTTKPTGDGTGLGLSLSYDIVVQGHGGMLAVAPGQGQGTTFVVTLPAAQT